MVFCSDCYWFTCVVKHGRGHDDIVEPHCIYGDNRITKHDWCRTWDEGVVRPSVLNDDNDCENHLHKRTMEGEFV